MIWLWRLGRLGAASWLAWLCWSFVPTERFHAELDAMDDAPFERRFRQQFEADQLSEAAVSLNAGCDAQVIPSSDCQRYRLQLDARRESAAYRWSQASHGAITGEAPSDTALAGAVVADLFVIGDIRDLVIQSIRWTRGEPTDPVIAALSGVGLALTLAPSADLGTALLKAGRRAGALSARFTRSVVRMARRSGDGRRIAAVTADARRLARQTDAATTLRILRHVEHPADLALAGRLTRRAGLGAYALEHGGRTTLRMMKTLGRQGDAMILRAARKGGPGLRLLARTGRLALRPHPLLGLAKFVRKGRAREWVERQLLQDAGPIRWGASGWLVLELWLLSGWLRRRRGRRLG